MDASELVFLTAIMLQDKVLIDMVGNCKYSDSRSAQKITVALCDALSEMSHKFPVALKKTFDTADGNIPNEDICNTGAFTVLRVTSSDKDVPFTTDSFGVHVRGGGKYTVTYTPEVYIVDIYSDFEVASDTGYVMMMHLLARNYCLLSGRTEEAAMYDSRYNDYVEARSLKRRAHIPARRFL